MVVVVVAEDRWGTVGRRLKIGVRLFVWWVDGLFGRRGFRVDVADVGI